jgi:hypothetical protein
MPDAPAGFAPPPAPGAPAALVEEPPGSPVRLDQSSVDELPLHAGAPTSEPSSSGTSAERGARKRDESREYIILENVTVESGEELRWLVEPTSLKQFRCRPAVWVVLPTGQRNLLHWTGAAARLTGELRCRGHEGGTGRVGHRAACSSPHPGGSTEAAGARRWGQEEAGQRDEKSEAI